MIDSIVTGDACEVMHQLPDDSIGMVLTSPPYNVGLHYDGYDDNLPHDEFVEFNRQWLSEAYRVASSGARLYAVISDKMLFWFRDVALAGGWTYQQKLTWCKPNFVSCAGKITNDWNHMTEDILLFRKGKRTPMLNGESTTHNWFVEVSPQSNYKEGRIHPAQMPISLCMKLIDRTPGTPILDPFCGSGSVLVAAKKLGRQYIGIELVEAVAERARVRLDATQLPLLVTQPQQAPLFAADRAGGERRQRR
jgi:DNA modification methylase